MNRVENDQFADLEMRQIEQREQRDKQKVTDQRVKERENNEFLSRQIRDHQKSKLGSPVITKVGAVGMNETELSMNRKLLLSIQEKRRALA